MNLIEANILLVLVALPYLNSFDEDFSYSIRTNDQFKQVLSRDIYEGL